MAKSSKKNRNIFAKQVLLDEGWKNNVRIEVASDGTIKSIVTDATAKRSDTSVGIIVPGIPNLHSHAFQRAMTGLTEHKSPDHEEDNFWTWRDKMYEFANKLTPTQIKDIYKQVYKEMLEAGYTSVAEFHYIHHDMDGKPYDPPTLISDIIIEAAKEVGLPITMLPVFYAHSNFGGKEPHSGQRRFINTPDQFLDMLSSLRTKYEDDPNVTVGMAFHSLRAATPEEMATILNSDVVKGKNFPIHIHVSEQTKEVTDCLAWSEKRPVEWLLDNFPIDKRWTLIHATHLTETEVSRLAASGAVVGFCPSTEANLGDGTAPAKRYLELGGKWGVGSDSNTEINAFGELRILEYSQRLEKEKRNVLAIGNNSTGKTLYVGATLGGEQALSLPVGGLKVGAHADFVVLDSKHPSLFGKKADEVLESVIFGTKSNKSPIIGVMTRGEWQVFQGKHRRTEIIEDSYNRVMSTLLGCDAIDDIASASGLQRTSALGIVSYEDALVVLDPRMLLDHIDAQSMVIQQLMAIIAAQQKALIFGGRGAVTTVLCIDQGIEPPYPVAETQKPTPWTSRIKGESPLQRTASFSQGLDRLVEVGSGEKSPRSFLSRSCSSIADGVILGQKPPTRAQTPVVGI